MSASAESLPEEAPPRGRLWKSLLGTLPVLLVTFVTITYISFPDVPTTVASLVTFLGANVIFFLMLYTGRTDRYRSILFIATAIAFPIAFILGLYEVRGTFMVLTHEDIVSGQTPFCHIAITQTLLTALLKGEIVFPGTVSKAMYSIGSMLVIWAVASLSIGRGWCGWTCFYGGWEDGFSRLLKRPRIKKIDRRWTYMPYAVLLGTALLSAATLSPQYCWWLCPFKAVSEFEEVTSTLLIVQTVIFFTLFAGLVVALPLLTRKRTQCSFLCPFGALQSLTNKISPFDIRIDRDKCTSCQRCVRECQVLALDEKALARGEPGITCTRCGRCVDACPKGAIRYHIKGTPVGKHPTAARLLFLYPAFLFLAIMGGGFIRDALHRIILGITTGSMVLP
jgi:ferredoxin-type protein NapH